MRTFLINALMLLLYVGAGAQTKKTVPEVAPATTMEAKEKSISVKTSNPEVAVTILKTATDKDSQLKSCHISWKTDRMGRYAQYSFTFGVEAYNHLVEFFKKYNK